eukprot:scaffold12452_cov47-Attheya_sp.AAC.3
MEACVSPYSPPVSVTLPPRLPPNRLGHSTQVEGVVEQYERFIFVMEFFFSDTSMGASETTVRHSV